VRRTQARTARHRRRVAWRARARLVALDHADRAHEPQVVQHTGPRERVDTRAAADFGERDARPDRRVEGALRAREVGVRAANALELGAATLDVREQAQQLVATPQSLGHEAWRERMRKQGAVDYVTKPFGREMLRQALQRATTRLPS
jgi:DNA-binding NtrC family response regulator